MRRPNWAFVKDHWSIPPKAGAGWMDRHRQAGGGIGSSATTKESDIARAEPYLKEAMLAVAARDPAPHPVTKPYACSIKYWVPGRTRIVRRVIIRPAVLAERRSLEALQWRASLGNEGDREALLLHPDAIELPVEQIAAGGVFVLEQDGAIVGFSAILPRDDGDTELDALFVEPGVQRRGVGRKLLEHCAETARSMGSCALHVVGNIHAKPFYLSCGFTIVGSFDTRFGMGLLMRKSLRDA